MSFPRTTPTATILNGASLSNAVFIGHGRLIAIQMPAAWTAASLTFQGSLDGTTYNDIYDNAGNEVTFSAAAARLISVDQFYGANWIKVRSGPSAAAVNQGADRALGMLVQKNPIP